MAKAKGWLYSLEAKGRMGHTLVGRNGVAGCSVAPYTAPGGSPSEAQTEWRKILKMASNMTKYWQGTLKWDISSLEFVAKATRTAKTARGYLDKMAIWCASTITLMQPGNVEMAPVRMRGRTGKTGGIDTYDYWLEYPTFAVSTDHLDAEWGYAIFLVGVVPYWQVDKEPRLDYSMTSIWQPAEEVRYSWLEMEMPSLQWDYASHEWRYAVQWMPVTGVFDWQMLTWL